MMSDLTDNEIAAMQTSVDLMDTVNPFAIMYSLASLRYMLDFNNYMPDMSGFKFSRAD